ncbi:DgyrCDS1133 [Dimorphilus gyrociliatus]|uniref:DgyrCDS1133 n=1 Tax=Dimorphilus gyrociliatus TaxID=2664684 RepID=A0A7I8V9H4_9ANNE|nr:DgyrCDS1133 [Dimorphilus gyrociliatus]
MADLKDDNASSCVESSQVIESSSPDSMSYKVVSSNGVDYNLERRKKKKSMFERIFGKFTKKKRSTETYADKSQIKTSRDKDKPLPHEDEVEANSQSPIVNTINQSSVGGAGLKCIKNNLGPLQMSNNETSASSGDSVVLSLPVKRPETMAGKGAMQMPEVLQCISPTTPCSSSSLHTNVQKQTNIMDSKLLKCPMKQPIPVPPPKIDDTHARSITSNVTTTETSSSSILPNQPVSIMVKSTKFPRTNDIPSNPDAQNSPHNYDEVPTHEPDSNKQPKRSAMKGGRLAERKKLIEQKHHEVVVATKNEKIKPKVAPKPKPFNPLRISSDNKENLVPTLGDVPYEQDNIHTNGQLLTIKIERKNSLNRLLMQRPGKRELIERHILQESSESDRAKVREDIGIQLNRRLSLRPTAEELREKNILHIQTNEQRMQQIEETKKTLTRKLSYRPSVDELRQRKIIRFNDYVEVTDANEYDRRAEKPWTKLTAKDKAIIRKELNDFKSQEMNVHEESKRFTRYHRP